ALVVAPLPEIGNNIGAKVATVTDPRTNLSLRSTMWYDPGTSGGKTFIKYDVLYGAAAIDPNKACILCVNQ
ncbi:MAG: hypothetical protein HQK77_20485, partial [Desulfobacterales bacterium]|nr:hypothetical protein [Desulfobacterales bacterium]